MRLAARYADIWSAFATESSMPKWFAPMLARIDDACSDVGHEPPTLGRSIGVFVEPTDEHTAEATGFGVPITGAPREVAETIARFKQIGATRVELVLLPGTEQSVEAIAPAIQPVTR